MADQVTHTNAVRLIVHWPQVGNLAEWTLARVATRKGVPHAHIVARGRIPVPALNPTDQQVWAVLADVVEDAGTH